MNKLRRFPELLGSPDMAPLERVLQRGRQLYRLSALIKEKLGPELDPHARVGNIREGTLVLLVSSTAWATRLRYIVPELLQRFHQDKRLSKINNIQIRVSPDERPSQRRDQRKATMSAEASNCIRQCAEGVSDEKLRDALSRLANRRPGKKS